MWPATYYSGFMVNNVCVVVGWMGGMQEKRNRPILSHCQAGTPKAIKGYIRILSRSVDFFVFRLPHYSRFTSLQSTHINSIFLCFYLNSRKRVEKHRKYNQG